VANGLSVMLIHSDSKANVNMRSAYLHLFTDMLSSVAVVMGGLAMLVWPAMVWIDPVLTIAIGVYLVMVSWGLLMTTLKILMQFAPSEVDLEQVRRRLESLPQVNNVHHTHLWSLNEDTLHFECHVDTVENYSLKEAAEVRAELRRILHDEFGIEHATIQMEKDCCSDQSFILDE